MNTHKAGSGSVGLVNGKHTFIPDARYYVQREGERLAAIKEDRHSLAVLNGKGTCIGWMLAADVATSERPDTNTDEVTVS